MEAADGALMVPAQRGFKPRVPRRGATGGRERLGE